MIKRKLRIASLAFILAFLSLILLHLKSPYGFPERKNPFPKKPFIRFLKNNLGNDRFTATETIFFPNFSSSYSLYDVKFINSISIKWYQHFIESYLIKNKYRGWEAERLWFTRIPLSASSQRQVYENLSENLKYYPLLSVKFIVMPKDVVLNLPLEYSDNKVRIYKNPEYLPRTFIVNNFLYAKDWKEAEQKLKYIDFRKTAILEKKIFKDGFQQLSLNKSWAYIKEYTASKIILEAKLEKPALIVLTDTFYPGWKAYVDGRKREILRVDGLLKGVYLDKGKHRVILYYQPLSFVLGCIGAGISLLVCIVLSYPKLFRKR